ncbi:Inhibitor of growth protein 3 [Serendipita sp. 398]|nr:Inhibitor of growth protein 3 [Serendipita sp. 398]
MNKYLVTLDFPPCEPIWLMHRSAHLREIPSVLKQYYQLRVKMEEDVAVSRADAGEKPAEVIRPAKRAASRASFSSASLTPITDSPSVRSLSLPNVRQGSGESDVMEDDDVEEQDTSFETERSLPPPPTSTQLITRVATLATNAVRGSVEKVNLSKAAHAVIDRHIRALDIAIADQESTIEVGKRPGTLPGAAAQANETSPTHVQSPSFESNGLLALAEVASVFHAAEKTLESLQPQVSEISSSVATRREKRRSSPVRKDQATTTTTNKTKDKPKETKPEETKPKPKPKQQTKKERRTSKKSNAAIPAEVQEEEEVIDPNEPTWCYCERVSFGNMIGCDGPNCKREWFHWECVGITREPPVNSKWFCRDCEAQEPAKKKRKR